MFGFKIGCAVATAALAENRASSLAALSAIRSLAPLGISELQERRPTEADQIRVLLARSRISLWPDVRKEAVSVTAQLLLPYAKRILRTRYDDQCWEAFASVCETYDAYQHPLKGLAPAPIESHLRARFRFIKFDAWFASLPEEVRKERHRVDFLRRKLKRSLNRSPNVDELRAACLERGMDRTSIAYLVEGKSDVLLSTPIADGLSFQDIIEESDGDLGDQKGGISRGHVRRRVRR